MQIQGSLVKEFCYDFFQPLTLEELFAEILMSGKISPQDCYRLKLALLSDFLSEDHHAIITRLLYSVRRGTIKVSE